MEVDEYIVSKIKALIPNVYADFNPITSSYPCVIIDSDSSEPVECMDEATDFENFRYEIAVWSASKSTTALLARQIRELLDNTAISGIINIDKIIYKGQSSDYLDLTGPSGRAINETAKVYGINLDFEFWTHL